MARTQEQRRADTRTRLLEAAADLFATRGIDAVSVDAVADAADRTSGAVYDHFGSKHGLVLAVLDSWKRSFLSLMSSEVAASDDPADQLASVWEHVGAGPEAERWALLEHELQLRAARDPEVAAALAARAAEGRRRSARELAGWCQAVGARPAVGPDDLAVLVKALLSGLELQQRAEPGSVPTTLAVRGLAALMGLDVTPPSERRQPASAAST